ncbi:acyltransferase family protein [Arthrobacter psychrochitiniphilus]|uniref:Acyltransferase n=1 Tax=Arthrobacter psychrochitiniphilus TaxID=291045 RepID=A0A2V3DVX4_9MICC|nr:acyltransferase family protein [Arthrobacter psychrochitiniphilus]NYG16611.1 peptidoglycan/LPS O-acetylase OafA/YrhL [Arthrobacter psychrochitiniphilus]PXA69273.1 acyltransferase [Arthrobacter psychrochitiniphilus]
MALLTRSIRAEPEQPGQKKVSSFRPDIQGLRALAVVAVIADHLFGYPLGGFVGVDVFFVISGFIITGLLLREHDKSGRISFADFYRRRVRRIMPVALVVLTVTTVASWYLFAGGRARSILWDGIASSLFAANWRFAATGTDYMQADGPVSPLQHYWSLSVEEQFYLIWPLILVAVLGFLAGRFSWSATMARRVLGVVLIAVAAASLAFAFGETSNAPTVAYFSTFSRAWELGIGAFVAVLAPQLARIPAVIRPAIQWAGLLGIIASLFVITPATAFPAPGALLPVVATAMVIAGGIGSQRYMLPLTNPVSLYIGDISYSLYLWHFPVIVFGAVIAPSMGPLGYLVALGVILMLSVASYHFVEDPLRHSQWLEPRGRNQRAKVPFQLTVKTQVLGLALLAVAAIGVSGVALIKAAPTDHVYFGAGVAQVTSRAEVPDAPATPEGAIQAKVSAALQASVWPALKPSVDDLGSEGFEKDDSEGCAPATPRGKDCSLALLDPEKLAVVVGDSMGAAWLPTIRAALEPQGWTVKSMTYVGCPFLDAATVAADDSITRACPGHKAIVSSAIKEAKPALVIVSNLYNLKLASGATGDAAVSEWNRAATTARTGWIEGAGKVVTLAPPPTGKDPNACFTRISTPNDCSSRITSTWKSYAEADQRVSKIVGDHYIDNRSWFCSVDQLCPLFIDGTIVRRDATHLTEEYATKLAPLLQAELTSILK